MGAYTQRMTQEEEGGGRRRTSKFHFYKEALREGKKLGGERGGEDGQFKQESRTGLLTRGVWSVDRMTEGNVWLDIWDNSKVRGQDQKWRFLQFKKKGRKM